MALEAVTNELQLNSTEEIKEWLNSQSWPTPNWFNQTDVINKNKFRSYEEYYTRQLRTRYIELEGDFRTFGQGWWYDFGTAKRVVELLHMTRQALEKKNPDLLTISSTLEIVDRYMVWLYPPWIARARSAIILSRAKLLKNIDEDLISSQIYKLLFEENIDDRNNMSALGRLRAIFDEIIGAWNKQLIAEQISNGLQIERLKTVSRWGLIALVVYLVISPFVTNLEALKQWPSSSLSSDSLIIGWISAVGIASAGAIGGLLSGLLQARNSRVTLIEYQENMLRLQLKPLVGSIIALVLFSLLSWEILSVVDVMNTGTYVLLAFLSGFSERYFLRLLELRTDDDSLQEELAKIETQEKLEVMELEQKKEKQRNSNLNTSS